MEKIIYYRNKKSIREKISIVDAYEIYALNNDLPAYNAKLKNDGEFYFYRSPEGIREIREASFSYEEMIAKIVFTLFNGKNIVVSNKIIDEYVVQKDAKGLGTYLVQALEEELKIEACQLENNAMSNLVLRFGKDNALDMRIGTVVFDENNELHVAFGKVRRAMYDIAEGWCE